MAHQSPKPPKKLAVEKEMSEIGEVRRRGLGLGIKFTLPVSVAISLVIVLMGLVIYSSTSEDLERDINQNGIFASRLAAAPEIDSWNDDYNTSVNLQSRVAQIDAALALAHGDFGKPAPAMATEEAARIRAQIEQHDKKQREFNQRRLAGLLSHGILDLVIVVGEDKIKASASGRTKLSYQADQYFTLAVSPETRIASGVYELTGASGGSQWEPARFFSHPIRDREGQKVGTATVVVSERDLRQDLKNLRSQILFFCLTGVLTCAIAALASSKWLTRPLAALLGDIQAVAGGDLHHRTRPRSTDEIGSLALAFDQMTKNLAAAEQMRVTLAEKEHQVVLAQEIQERLFPKRLPEAPGLRLEAGNRLAGDLSADLIDTLVLEDQRVGVLVMTASGRGVPAAIILSMARSLFRARGAQQASPVEALTAINALLAPDLRRGMYVSALYAIIDPRTGAGRFASAGHRVPAMHFIAASHGLRRLQSSGIAMGLDKGPVFDRSLTEGTFTLAPGDRLVLATEGAFLLTDHEGKPAGEETFLKLVLAACKHGAGAVAVLASLTERLGPPVDRDITLVSVTREAPGPAGA